MPTGASLPDFLSHDYDASCDLFSNLPDLAPQEAERVLDRIHIQGLVLAACPDVKSVVEARMAKAEIQPGSCGFTTHVIARADGSAVELEIQSQCQAIMNLASHLTRVDPYEEISYRGSGPQTLALARKYCHHPACPVPSGIIKAIEVAAGLALPATASIQLSKSDHSIDGGEDAGKP